MTKLRVEVYTKPDCTLCGPVLATVEKVRKDTPFELQEIDISKDAALMEKYGAEIPVVSINGRKAFKYRVGEAELRRKLRRSRGVSEDRVVEAREDLDPPPFVPARPIAAAALALTLGAFLYFIALGFSEAQAGNGRLAAKLLDARPRDQVPIGFQLESLRGAKIDLSDYKDKVVLLNFWATWCPPCVEEMPSMYRLHERMKNEPRFVMLAVSADDGWEPVKKFFSDKQQPGFQVLLDKSGEVAKRYGTTMFPETYVLVNNRVVGFIEGPRDWDKWFADAYLKAL